MTEASPRPWRTGTSPGVDGRTIYSPVPGYPRDKLIGTMDTAADAGLAVAAVNGYGEPTSIEADLRTGWKETERRRRIAAVVAAYHQQRIVGFGIAVLVPQVLAAFECVLAALGGSVDLNVLGIAEDMPVIEQVRAIVASTGGEVARG